VLYLDALYSLRLLVKASDTAFRLIVVASFWHGSDNEGFSFDERSTDDESSVE
jgi:hypothetical protein